MFAHDLAERYSGKEVVVVVLERHYNALANSLESRKMDDAAYIVFREDRVQPASVSDIDLIETDILPGYLLDPLHSFGAGVDEVVDHNDVIALGQKLDTSVAADITGTSGYKNGHNL